MNENFWDEMREQDFTLVTAPARKLAVFPNSCGMVVLVTEGEDEKCITEIDVSEIDEFIALLKAAKLVAKQLDAEIQADYAIYRAKNGEAKNG